jgi:hypothetical protein
MLDLLQHSFLGTARRHATAAFPQRRLYMMAKIGLTAQCRFLSGTFIHDKIWRGDFWQDDLTAVDPRDGHEQDDGQ